MYTVVQNVVLWSGRKRVSADQGKHCYTFAGCRNHECKVCQWHAAGKTGTGIRKVWLKSFNKTMANWIISCADRYLGLLYGQMKEEFLKSRYIHCDETRIQVIDEPDQKGSSQNWMWVYLTDHYSEAPQMVLFDYERTRAGYHPVNFLGDTFHGYLTCDGYQAYHGLNDSITVTGCFTHARRRFDAALTALKRTSQRSSWKKQLHIRQWRGSESCIK